MAEFTDRNNPGLVENGLGETESGLGYRIERIIELKQIQAVFYELLHVPTNARHIHISRNDTENTFAAAFKTVPSDSTGVAHILEHTALCGSKKFRVRDPFFSMLKRSLKTFMNAFTASDWTMYPFSTQNKNDFYNLMDVYLDAAFFPNLDNLSFTQEGHRLEFEKTEENEEKLVYKGVVYNEMKGAMSSPDQVFYRSLLGALYPDTTYHYNSGGEPSDIPTLTHEQLVNFHKRHYHPSNSYLYTYGNLPLQKHLIYIHDRILKNFEKIDPNTDVPNQPRWDKPKTVTKYYPLEPMEDSAKKSQVCVTWMTADIQDTFAMLTLSVLEQVLFGNPASPMYKALIESGLGSALSDATGFDADNRDTFFSCGLKGIDPADGDKIEGIVFDTLKELVDKGIDKELIDSAIHQIEFHKKEVTNSPYPYGIKLLLQISGTWFHAGDPERVLNLDNDLKQLENKLATGRFLEEKIREYFLDNPHRVSFYLEPDKEMSKKEEKRVTAELEKIKEELTPEEKETIRENAKKLKMLQDSAEDISCLPTLAISDIPKSVPSVTKVKPYDNFGPSFFRQPTSGIFYFSAAAGAGILKKSLLPLVPFFCRTFSKIGTARRDYTDLARLIDMYTGGLGISAHARTCFDQTAACMPFLVLNGKCLARNQAKMFEILTELVHEYAFTDLARLKNLLMEYKAGLESMIVHNGHGLAMSLAAKNFSQTRSLSEMWNGVSQIRTIKALTEDLTEERLKSISEDLQAIAAGIFIPDNMKIALIGEDHELGSAVEPAKVLAKNLIQSSEDRKFTSPDINPDKSVLPREGWSTSTAVSFVASCFETVRMEHEHAPALYVISKLLKSLYIHGEIREKGGAYGGFSLYNAEDGLFTFGSYRDPHIVSTLDVYDGADNFLLSAPFSDEDVKESILQACSEIDKPDSPGAAARKSFFRNLISLNDDIRKQFKSRILDMNRKKIMEAAEKYFSDSKKKRSVAVVSNSEKLEKANEKLKGRELNLHKI
ncbi:insulinase family protein [Desulfobacterales bacterium HSG16]|nr:insulinase family protein [Desulfobacterales bacterium HSG16]